MVNSDWLWFYGLFEQRMCKRKRSLAIAAVLAVFRKKGNREQHCIMLVAAQGALANKTFMTPAEIACVLNISQVAVGSAIRLWNSSAPLEQKQFLKLLSKLAQQERRIITCAA